MWLGSPGSWASLPAALLPPFLCLNLVCTGWPRHLSPARPHCLLPAARLVISPSHTHYSRGKICVSHQMLIATWTWSRSGLVREASLHTLIPHDPACVSHRPAFVSGTTTLPFCGSHLCFLVSREAFYLGLGTDCSWALLVKLRWWYIWRRNLWTCIRFMVFDLISSSKCRFLGPSMSDEPRNT